MYDILNHKNVNIVPELELQIKCLQSIIGTHLIRAFTNRQLIDCADTVTTVNGQDEHIVTMEQFGKVLAWFGNLKTDGIVILEKV